MFFTGRINYTSVVSLSIANLCIPYSILTWIFTKFLYTLGNYYVKVGHREAYRVPLNSVHEMAQWYRHPHSGINGRTKELLKNMLHAYLPGRVFRSLLQAYFKNIIR